MSLTYVLISTEQYAKKNIYVFSVNLYFFNKYRNVFEKISTNFHIKYKTKNKFVLTHLFLRLLL